MIWLDLKTYIAALTGLERDALHIYAALAIQLVSALVLRVPLSRWRPVLVVLAIAAANEAADLTWDIWPSGDRGMQWIASAHDMLNTLAVPLLLMVAARSRLLPRDAYRAGEVSAASDTDRAREAADGK